jgi:plastocyanin
VFSETVVAENGLLQNALVFLAKGAETWEVPPPQGQVLVDQQGCVYRPHVLGARVGQAIAIRNSDPVLHNVHALAKTNGGFNLSMPRKGEVATKRFGKPEILALKCDVHPWMGARIGVFDHPWFAVTGSDGKFTLAGVPPGRYTVTAWHETLGERSLEVTVPPKGSVEASFVIGVAMKGDR